MFKEAEEMFVGFAPSIDVSSYGDNEEQALHAVKEAISIYFDYTRNKGTLEEDLRRMGWKKNSMKSTNLIAPVLNEIRQENPILLDTMNLPKSYQIIRISIPA